MSVLSGELGHNPIRMTVGIDTPRFNHATVGDADPSVRICETVTPAKSKKKREAKKKKKKRIKAQRQKASREATHVEEPLNHTQSHAIDIAMTKLPSMENMWKQLAELEKRMDMLEERMDKLEERMDKAEERMDKVEESTNELRKKTDELWKQTDELWKKTDELKKDTDELRKRVDKVEEAIDELKKDSDGPTMGRATSDELKNLFDPGSEEESQAAPREELEDSQLLPLAKKSFDQLVVNLGGYKACNEAK